MINQPSFDFTVGVHSDPEYHYEAVCSEFDEMALVYKEDRVEGDESLLKRVETCRIAFSSLDEMQAVAKAMLRVVTMARTV